ncbi:ParB family chromosome partitioning protein [Variovorax boronicumulans]|uniref:ParB/RepB/Spo0J family partition protein n=1 Tax=Variovorax boronicumulans TaxID=436515 RepID=UPI0027888E22|nr:ParB/RepB/Spo0J family partition protein [Variovorax boronicumulans]MDP9993994.1 ParB family chromosome partitioning protein [Variovorax boronicumulans]MDQ0005143.1 ParB family chromosome partitioning protein [Variovorax boronicumulans]
MGLRDKASKIDFASLTSGAALSPDTKQPKTAPGAMMAFANDARSDLLRENEELRVAAARAAGLEAQLGEVVEDLRAWDGAKATRLLDPASITRSRYANRHESSFDGEEFDRLKREIQEAGGNVQPIKVRPSSGKVADGEVYEIVFGHRRHEACRQLGLPVLAVVDNLDDRSLFVEMERENRERQDLSPWEQGMMYARALDLGLFPSNKQLAAALGIDHSNVGKSLALARLPDTVVGAFRSPLDIQLRWAPLLNKALETDAQGVLARAQALALKAPRPSAKDVLAALVSGQEGLGVQARPHALQVAGKKAATLTFDADGRATIRIHLPLADAKRQQLQELLEEFMSAL